MIARCSLCRGMVGYNRIYFIGQPHNVEAATELYTWIESQFSRLASDATIAYQPKSWQVAKNKFRYDFLAGMMFRLAERLREAQKSIERREMQTTALIVRHDELNDAFLREKYPNVRTWAYSAPERSFTSWQQGYQTGDLISLFPPSKQIEDRVL